MEPEAVETCLRPFLSASAIGMWPVAGAAFNRDARVFIALIELNQMIKLGAFQCFGF
jgi:hypothetical protein